MKRSTYLLLGLTALILVVAYYIVRPTDRIEATYETPDIQLSLDIAQITKVDIQRTDMHVTIEKMQGNWEVTYPFKADVDMEQFYKLLEGMAKFRLTGLISSKPEKQATYHVDDGGTLLTVTYSDGKVVSIVVGKSGPTANQAYVRPVSSNSVYLAKGILPSILNRDLPQWRNRIIYRTDPDAIKLVSVRRGADRALMRRDGNRWLSDNQEVPKSVVTPTIATLSDIQAENFVDTAIILSSGPLLHLEVVAREIAKMDMYSASGTYLLKTSLSPVLYVISKPTADALRRIADALYTPASVASLDEGAALGVPQRQAPQVSNDADISASARKVLESLALQQSQRPPAGGARLEDVGELKIHTIGRTETLEAIAQRYNVSKEQIKRWNVLSSDVVRPGWELYIFVMKK